MIFVGWGFPSASNYDAVESPIELVCEEDSSSISIV